MFKVKGKPFMPMGGQSKNSSAYTAEELASAIAGVKALGGNTLEAPVYWEQVEPLEGQFDFSSVDMLLEECRKNDLHLIVLWFATWKNGEMRYCPGWIKTDKKRFFRVLRSDGVPMNVLSAFCEEALQADTRAFQALMGHLKERDSETETVIAVQVENEPGILGCDRDYGPEANAALSGAVPSALLEHVKGLGEGSVWEVLQKNGSKEQGSWEEVFGVAGGELCTAWSIAKYIDHIASEGRAVYNLPMYTNAWLSFPGWPIPGFYPSGGPVRGTLDIWKFAAPHLDLIAPDIYSVNFSDYKIVCEDYHRPDNPLFIPESSPDGLNARNMLRALADYNAIGYFCFGVDSILDMEGNLLDDAVLFAESFRSVMSLLPLLHKYRGTGKVHAVVEEDYQINQSFVFEQYIGAVPFINLGITSENKDHRHARNPRLIEGRPKHGLIIEAGPREFYLAGNFHLFMVPGSGPAWLDAMKMPMVLTPVDYLSVEEGYLTETGEFVPTRTRNGDESVFGGFWVTPYCGVVRVVLTP
ncbi:DUF5597 domain-containing protein [Paenibacillus marinisediminis]